MSFSLLIPAVFIAILDWIAVAKNWRRVEYICKPGVMLFILAWLATNNAFDGAMLWFSLGILFSLVGDILLMLPREQILGGLVAFLLAHISYIVGFNQTPPPVNLPALILALLVLLSMSQVYRPIAAGVKCSDQVALCTPVLIYSIVISLMLLSGLLTLVRQEWSPGAAWLASAGALLFCISDILLSWNKFVAPITHGRLFTMITYHLGQLMLVLGAALHFLA